MYLQDEDTMNIRKRYGFCVTLVLTISVMSIQRKKTRLTFWLKNNFYQGNRKAPKNC